MMKTISKRQARWFSQWMLLDDGFLPSMYPRSVALLHPGTQVTGNPSLPFANFSATDTSLSDEQATTLDQVLLDVFGPETACTFGRYGGYLDDTHRDELVKQGLVRASGRLVYYLGAAPLSDCSFAAAALDKDGFFEQSFLWADDQSWFVSSEPDLAFTIVGCDNGLANRLLEDQRLNSRECSDLPVAHLSRISR